MNPSAALSYANILAVHDATAGKQAGYIRGWLKQPPTVKTVNGVEVMTVQYWYGEWPEFVYPVANRLPEKKA